MIMAVVEWLFSKVQAIFFEFLVYLSMMTYLAKAGAILQIGC